MEIEIGNNKQEELKFETASTVTFVEGSGGLEKSKSDSKLNQVSSCFCVMFYYYCFVGY